MVSGYESTAEPGEQAEIARNFRVCEVVNTKERSRIASTSLFSGMGDSAPGDGPWTEGSGGWDAYVKPVLEGAVWLRRRRADAQMRVYLGHELRFLLGRLVEAGCEVMLMEASSAERQPGMIWRYLAFEEEGLEVTILDAKRARLVVEDSRRTSVTVMRGPKFWRFANWQHGPAESYTPLSGDQFGGLSEGWDVTRLACAFVWLCRRGGMRVPPGEGACGEVAGWPRWPGAGVDAWFASAALFPRMARAGLLTIMSEEVPYFHLNAMDVDFCVRQNPDCEIFFAGAAARRKPIRISSCLR